MLYDTFAAHLGSARLPVRGKDGKGGGELSVPRITLWGPCLPLVIMSLKCQQVSTAPQGLLEEPGDGEGSVLEPSRGEARIGTEAGEHVSARWFLLPQSIFTPRGSGIYNTKKTSCKGQG